MNHYITTLESQACMVDRQVVHFMLRLWTMLLLPPGMRLTSREESVLIDSSRRVYEANHEHRYLIDAFLNSYDPISETTSQMFVARWFELAYAVQPLQSVVFRLAALVASCDDLDGCDVYSWITEELCVRSGRYDLLGAIIPPNPVDIANILCSESARLAEVTSGTSLDGAGRDDVIYDSVSTQCSRLYTACVAASRLSDANDILQHIGVLPCSAVYRAICFCIECGYAHPSQYQWLRSLSSAGIDTLHTERLLDELLRFDRNSGAGPEI